MMMKLTKAIEAVEALNDALQYNLENPLKNGWVYYLDRWEPRGWKFWKKKQKSLRLVIMAADFTEDGVDVTRRYDLELEVYGCGGDCCIRTWSLTGLAELITDAKVEVLKCALGEGMAKKLGKWISEEAERDAD